MAVDKIQTGLRLEPDALWKITYIAKVEKRSLNAQIEYLIENYISEWQAVHGVILPLESE